VSHEKVEILRRGYEAFNSGDLSVAEDLATPDVEWGTTGTFPGIQGVYRGPEAMQAFADALRSAWSWFEVSVAEVLRDEDDLLVVDERIRGQGRSSGVEVEMHTYAVYWFAGGKLRKRNAFTARETALEAAGGQGSNAPRPGRRQT
jgi:ketosteroid isomerase-like protein